MCAAHTQNIGVCYTFPKQLLVSILKTGRQTEDKISEVFGFDLFVDVTQQGFVSFCIFVSLYPHNFFLHSTEWKIWKIPETFFMYTVHSPDHLCSPFFLLLLNNYTGKRDFVGTRDGNTSVSIC